MGSDSLSRVCVCVCVCGAEEGVFLAVSSPLADYKGNSRLSDGWSRSRMLKVLQGEKLAASDSVCADDEDMRSDTEILKLQKQLQLD